MISIVIRTYNEQKHLRDLLVAIQSQQPVTDRSGRSLGVEVIVVDSGSTDATLQIAFRFGARIIHIAKEDFTFGKSLNLGCDIANGELLVFVSGHCVPVNSHWLQELVSPLINAHAQYCYGRQIGKGTTKFSESRLFEKHFPRKSRIPQKGWFCNNANAAVVKKYWQRLKFDEELTGLEDIDLAQKIQKAGGFLAYVATAKVYHLHDEAWTQVRTRYEREAVALQKIRPELHFSVADLAKCLVTGVFGDCRAAIVQKKLMSEWLTIFCFRWNQFFGIYRGYHRHRKLSQETKQRYFYPTVESDEVLIDRKENYCPGPIKVK